MYWFTWSEADNQMPKIGRSIDSVHQSMVYAEFSALYYGLLPFWQILYTLIQRTIQDVSHRLKLSYAKTLDTSHTQNNIIRKTMVLTTLAPIIKPTSCGNFLSNLSIPILKRIGYRESPYFIPLRGIKDSENPPSTDRNVLELLLND